MSKKKPTYENLLNQIDQPQPFLFDATTKINLTTAVSVKFTLYPTGKEQPMLFSTPMVQALLNGTKTETRRDKNLKEINEDTEYWQCDDPFVMDENELLTKSFFSNYRTGEKRIIKKPWQVGNILWVKETWKPAIEGKVTMYNAIRYKADSASMPLPDEDMEWFNNLTKDGKYNWQSSMFMRRKFARIFLRITDVKLERLHDITEEGAIAEGASPSDKNMTQEQRLNNYNNPSNKLGWSHRDGYSELWDKINGDGSWANNPFCWVIKFEKLENYGK